MFNLEILKSAWAVSHDGLFIAEKRDADLVVLLCNQKFSDITGLSEAKSATTLVDKIFEAGFHEENRLQLKKALEEEQGGMLKLSCKNPNGQVFWVLFKWEFQYGPADETYMTGALKDITQEEYTKNVMEKVNYLFREMSRRLEYTNETDQLTKLKNRGHLCTRGEFLLGAAKREKLRIHAVVLDVDNFKALNLAGGAGLGDECLITVADIIVRYFCRATDICIRLCDDEFVVLCIEDDDSKILERIDSVRFDIANTKIRDTQAGLHDISVSVGIHSVNPEKHTTLDDMIHKAGELVFTHIPTHRNRITHISDHQKIKTIAR